MWYLVQTVQKIPDMGTLKFRAWITHCVQIVAQINKVKLFNDKIIACSVCHLPPVDMHNWLVCEDIFFVCYANKVIKMIWWTKWSPSKINIWIKLFNDRSPVQSCIIMLSWYPGSFFFPPPTFFFVFVQLYTLHILHGYNNTHLTNNNKIFIRVWWMFCRMIS